MVLPKDRVVYRGLKDIRLPDEFLKEDAFGVCGGLELGLMSTTVNQELAIQYAGNNVPTVFEIRVGAVDRGAPLQWVSQYRGEEEILFPPRSFLEVTGETRMQTWPSGRTTRVVVLSVNANQTCGTIDESLGSRRRLHVATLENYQAEIRGELQARLDSEVDHPTLGMQMPLARWRIVAFNHVRQRCVPCSRQRSFSPRSLTPH